MKCKLVGKQEEFKPFSIQFDIETKEELAELIGRLNVNMAAVREDLSGGVYENLYCILENGNGTSWSDQETIHDFLLQIAINYGLIDEQYRSYWK